MGALIDAGQQTSPEGQGPDAGKAATRDGGGSWVQFCPFRA